MFMIMKTDNGRCFQIIMNNPYINKDKSYKSKEAAAKSQERLEQQQQQQQRRNTAAPQKATKKKPTTAKKTKKPTKKPATEATAGALAKAFARQTGQAVPPSQHELSPSQQEVSPPVPPDAGKTDACKKKAAAQRQSYKPPPQSIYGKYIKRLKTRILDERDGDLKKGRCWFPPTICPLSTKNNHDPVDWLEASYSVYAFIPFRQYKDSVHLSSFSCVHCEKQVIDDWSAFLQLKKKRKKELKSQRQKEDRRAKRMKSNACTNNK